MTPLRQRMLEDMRVRNLAPKTQRTYIGRVAEFARHFGRSPDELGPEEIRAYQVALVERRVSWSLFNQSVCALRFLYRVTLGKDWAVEHIPFPRQEKKLPVVLSLSEVAQFFHRPRPPQVPGDSHDRLRRRAADLGGAPRRTVSPMDQARVVRSLAEDDHLTPAQTCLPTGRSPSSSAAAGGGWTGA